MKRLFFLLFIGITIACGTTHRTSSRLKDGTIFITRKYVGQFIDYRHTGPNTFSGPNLIWIKTSMENTFGKISAYGEKCEFSFGDRLYLTRTYYSPGGISAYWVYRIENAATLYYRATEYQNDKKVLTKSWF
jgi:hypothetical protein